MDLVFRALADPTRRLLLDRLRKHNGQTLRELCQSLAMARQSATRPSSNTRRQGEPGLKSLSAVMPNQNFLIITGSVSAAQSFSGVVRM